MPGFENAKLKVSNYKWSKGCYVYKSGYQGQVFYGVGTKSQMGEFSESNSKSRPPGYDSSDECSRRTCQPYSFAACLAAVKNLDASLYESVEEFKLVEVGNWDNGVKGCYGYVYGPNAGKVYYNNRDMDDLVGRGQFEDLIGDYNGVQGRFRPPGYDCAEG